jgi:hypothetical protein
MKAPTWNGIYKAELAKVLKAKLGLLWIGKDDVPLPAADSLAQFFGYEYA